MEFLLSAIIYFGSCAGQIPPLCLWPAEAICVHTGTTVSDYYICAVVDD